MNENVGATSPTPKKKWQLLGWVFSGISALVLAKILGLIPTMVAFVTYYALKERFGIVLSILASLLASVLVAGAIFAAVFGWPQIASSRPTPAAKDTALPEQLAKDTSFRPEQLAYGISLDVPSHWKVLPPETRKNLNAAGQAIVDNAGTKDGGGSKETLLAMNSTPDPTGAMVRLNVTTPSDFTQSYLAAATDADLKAVQSEMLESYRRLEASGGPKIAEMQPVRIELINDKLGLVISYIRAGVNGPSPWQVTQYWIPDNNRLIQITLSHRQSDAIMWRPILERVKRSVRF